MHAVADIAFVLFGGIAAMTAPLLTPPLAKLLRERGGAWYVGLGGERTDGS